MTTKAEWRVLPHDPIRTLSANVLHVQGDIEPGGPPLKRVMVVVRLGDGRLLVHNAMALDEPAMAQLDAFGPVAFVVVPNHWHRLDALRFAERYPDAKVLCPPGSRKKVEQVCRVDGTYDDFPADERVRFEVLDGLGGVEGAMIVSDDDGVTLVLTDAIFNMAHHAGLAGFILRYVTGSSGGPRISRLIRIFAVKDKRAFRAHLERLAALPRLRRVIVAHHEMLEDEPARVLREVAATL